MSWVSGMDLGHGTGVRGWDEGRGREGGEEEEEKKKEKKKKERRGKREGKEEERKKKGGVPTWDVSSLGRLFGTRPKLLGRPKLGTIIWDASQTLGTSQAL